MSTRFIALDRDGVINEDSDQFIKNPSEWKPIPGSLDGIAKLTQAGFLIVVVTNQSGLGRGLFDLGALNAIHNHFRESLLSNGGRIEMILFCPHDPSAHCDCRKPLTGLFLDLSERIGFSLAGLPFVGDSVSDVEVARRVGMEPILVRTGKGRRTLSRLGDRSAGIRIFDNLKNVADYFVI